MSGNTGTLKPPDGTGSSAHQKSLEKEKPLRHYYNVNEVSMEDGNYDYSSFEFNHSNANSDDEKLLAVKLTE